MHFLTPGLSQRYDKYIIRSTKWVPKAQGSPEISLSWASFNWFWKQVHWTQIFKHLLPFLYTSYRPLINDQRIIVWCRRPGLLPFWESRIGKTPGMSKGKGKNHKCCCRGASKEKLSYLSFMNSSQKKRRQSRREMLSGLRGSSGKHSSILPRASMCTFPLPKELARGLVRGPGPVHCTSELEGRSRSSFFPCYFSF